MASCLPRTGGKILVTGGTGFLGGRLTKRLVDEGYSVRILARKTSNIEPLKGFGVEIILGDLGEQISVDRALQGVTIVIHAGAGTSGIKKDCEIGTVLGTHNILEACKHNSIEKLIYISSCSVYGVTDYKAGQIVTEESSLERFPWRRGHYSASKQQAEALVTEAMQAGNFPIVVLRPGSIYGPGGEIFMPIIGLSLVNKIFLVFGDGHFVLPLVYIDNVVDAILQCIKTCRANNQIFNIVDTEGITKKRYMTDLVKKLYPHSYFIYLPFQWLYCLTWVQEKALRIFCRSPLLTTYRLVSSQRLIRFDVSKIQNMIGWKPRITFNQAVMEIVSYHGRS